MWGKSIVTSGPGHDDRVVGNSRVGHIGQTKASPKTMNKPILSITTRRINTPDISPKRSRHTQKPKISRPTVPLLTTQTQHPPLQTRTHLRPRQTSPTPTTVRPSLPMGKNHIQRTQIKLPKPIPGPARQLIPKPTKVLPRLRIKLTKKQTQMLSISMTITLPPHPTNSIGSPIPTGHPIRIKLPPPIPRTTITKRAKLSRKSMTPPPASLILVITIPILQRKISVIPSPFLPAPPNAETKTLPKGQMTPITIVPLRKGMPITRL